VTPPVKRPKVKSGIIEKMTIPANVHMAEVIAIPGMDNSTQNFYGFRHHSSPRVLYFSKR